MKVSICQPRKEASRETNPLIAWSQLSSLYICKKIDFCSLSPECVQFCPGNPSRQTASLDNPHALLSWAQTLPPGKLIRDPEALRKKYLACIPNMPAFCWWSHLTCWSRVNTQAKGSQGWFVLQPTQALGKGGPQVSPENRAFLSPSCLSFYIITKSKLKEAPMYTSANLFLIKIKEIQTWLKKLISDY
jgi:hypothetical protein